MKLGILTSSGYPKLPEGEDTVLKSMQGVWSDVLIWNKTQPSALNGYDALLVRTCWDYHRRYGEFIEWLARLEESGIELINPIKTIRWNSTKSYLLDLQSAGVRVIPTYPHDKWQQMLNDFPDQEKFIVKPMVSASAYQLKLVDRDNIASAAAKDSILQPFQEYIAYSGEWSLVYFGKTFSHAVHKKPKTGEHRVQKEYGGSAVITDPPAGSIAFADNVLKSLEYDFRYCRVDIIINNDEFLLMEIELIEPELFIRSSESAHNYESFVRSLVNLD